jgi:hypothetical protein
LFLTLPEIAGKCFLQQIGHWYFIPVVPVGARFLVSNNCLARSSLILLLVYNLAARS